MFRDHHETILNECEIRLTAAEKRLELFKKLQTRNEGLEADLADLKDQGQKAEKKLSEVTFPLFASCKFYLFVFCNLVFSRCWMKRRDLQSLESWN